jgi:hypothetical protein
MRQHCLSPDKRCEHACMLLHVCLRVLLQGVRASALKAAVRGLRHLGSLMLGSPLDGAPVMVTDRWLGELAGLALSGEGRLSQLHTIGLAQCVHLTDQGSCVYMRDCAN